MTLKLITVGGIKLQLLKSLIGTEPSEAQAFTYHSTVTILEHHSLLLCAQMISSIGDTVGYPFVGEQSIWEWDNVFKQQWKDPSRYEVISFHCETGVRIANATVAGDDMVLIPLGNDVHPLVMPARQPENVHFSHVKVDLDFNTLVEDDVQPCCVQIKFLFVCRSVLFLL